VCLWGFEFALFLFFVRARFPPTFTFHFISCLFFIFHFSLFKTGPCFTHGRKRILSAGRGEPLSLSIFLNFKEEEEEEEEEEERKKE